MGLDYYFAVFNGETGEKISLLEEGRRDHYYIMQRVISITEVAGCPCLDIERSDPKSDYYFYLKHGSQRPKVYQEKGFESLEEYALLLSNSHLEELEYYYQYPEIYRKEGFESLEEYVVWHFDSYLNEYIAWSGSIDLKKICRWFFPSSQYDDLEKEVFDSEEIARLTEDLKKSPKKLNDDLPYIDSRDQLKKGFELAFKTKGHVTMFVSY